LEDKRKEESSVKKFTKLISDSSQRILASFLSDGAQEQKKKEHIDRQIQLALSQKSLVVLQIKNKTNTNELFETIAGKLLKKNAADSVMIKEQKSAHLRIIKIEDIHKISLLQGYIANRMAND